MLPNLTTQYIVSGMNATWITFAMLDELLKATAKQFFFIGLLAGIGLGGLMMVAFCEFVERKKRGDVSDANI